MQVLTPVRLKTWTYSLKMTKIYQKCNASFDTCSLENMDLFIENDKNISN